jgi:hypothetical protein
MKRKALALLLLLFLASCGSEEKGASIPENVMDKNKMVAVLVDFHLAEAALKRAEQQGQDVNNLSVKYYSLIMKKHNMNSKKFNASLNFYNSNIKDYYKIYQNLVTELSKMQSKIMSVNP